MSPQSLLRCTAPPAHLTPHTSHLTPHTSPQPELPLLPCITRVCNHLSCASAIASYAPLQSPSSHAPLQSASLRQIVVNMDPDGVAFRTTMDKLNAFCTFHGLPRQRRQQLRQYLLEARDTQTAAQHAEVLQLLSPHLVLRTTLTQPCLRPSDPPACCLRPSEPPASGPLTLPLRCLRPSDPQTLTGNGVVRGIMRGTRCASCSLSMCTARGLCGCPSSSSGRTTQTRTSTSTVRARRVSILDLTHSSTFAPSRAGIPDAHPCARSEREEGRRQCVEPAQP
jgi:hypothetical protein